MIHHQGREEEGIFMTSRSSSSAIPPNRKRIPIGNQNDAALAPFFISVFGAIIASQEHYMKLFVARHGETDWNIMKKICGISESDLTENGWKQAEELAKRLLEEQDVNQIRHILVSPQRRAQQTASPIAAALGIKPVIRENLHEISFGVFEGKSWEDLQYAKAKEEPFCRFPEGESMLMVAQRIYNELDYIRTAYSENLLIVTHGSAMRILDTYFNDLTLADLGKLKVKNCEVREYTL